MTAGFYDEDIQAALEMIEEFGVQCLWTKDAAPPTDPDRPWLGGAPDPDDHQPFICFVPASSVSTSGFGLSKYMRDTEVADFSTFGLMGAQSFTPELTDKVTLNGKAIVVVAVDTLAPAGDPVLHILSIK